MPIYDYDCEKREVLDLGYRDSGREFSQNSRVVHFGTGDVLVSVAKSRQDVEDELVFQHTKRHPIGEYTPDKNVTADPPVRFLFDKPESIDVVIDMCQKLKAKMTAPNQVSETV